MTHPSRQLGAEQCHTLPAALLREAFGDGGDPAAEKGACAHCRYAAFPYLNPSH